METHVIDPIPLLMNTMSFFSDDLRRRGRSALVALIVPRILTLNPVIQAS
jgi:hypothetical protein